MSDKGIGTPIWIRRGLLAILGFCVAASFFALVSASAFAAKPGLDQTAMVSLPNALETPDGTPAGQANDNSYRGSISDNGCKVAFFSTATNLTSEPLSGASYQIYVRDMCVAPPTTTLVSKGPNLTNETQVITQTYATGGDLRLTFDGEQTDAIPYNASAAVFEAALEDLPNIGPGNVSVTGGPIGQDPPTPVVVKPPIVVEFRGALAGTNVSELTAQDNLTGGFPTSIVTRVQGGSYAQNNPPGCAGSTITTPAISGDGNHVAWVSNADNLSSLDIDPGDPTVAGFPCQDVYVRDLQANTTSLVSTNEAKNKNVGNADADGLGISGDGSYVVWATSVDARKVDGNVAVHAPPFSATGDVNNYNGPLRPDASEGPCCNGFSYDVFRWEATSGDNVLVSHPDGDSTKTANGASNTPVISANGTKVAFQSFASDLDPPKLNVACSSVIVGSCDTDVFVRDFAANGGSGDTFIVSRADGASGVHGNGTSYDPRISADGSTVVFHSNAINLGARTTGHNDIFVRDGDHTEQINRASGTTGDKQQSSGAITPQDSYAGGASRDGRFILFSANTPGSPALAEGTASDSNVYVRDRVNQTTFLANRANGVTGSPGNGATEAGPMSADPDPGTQRYYSIFSSDSTNLVPGDVNARSDVFMRGIEEPPEVQTGSTVNLRPLVLGTTINGVPLVRSTSVPVGSVIDVTSGRIELTADNAVKDSMRFFGGSFTVQQIPADDLTTLDLPTPVGCPPPVSAPANTGNTSNKKKKQKKKKKGRLGAARAGGGSLFGKGKGNFRTRGYRGAATVRGTEWYTEDTCAGTFFRLDSGGPLDIDDVGLPGLVDARLSAPGSSYLAAAASAPVAVAPKKCKKGFRLKNGKCVKRKKRK